MKVLLPLAVVAGLFLAALLGATSAPWVFGVAIPYLAIAVFVVGMIVRVLAWAGVPVPFRIPTTAGQQKSLPWIRRNRLDNPHSTLGVVGRMALEVLFFRSLLRNTRTEMSDGRLVYGTSLTLWAAALAMHWSMLIILVEHLRLFTQPVPAFVTFVQNVDGFLQVGLPVFQVFPILFLLALAYLLYRRLANPQVHYISLVSDYFPLFLLLGIGLTGFWMRHLSRTDVRGVKELALGLAHFAPVVPEGISSLFFAHLFLVSVLLAYFPFSKLVHAGGVFLSPTRNLANTNRAIRHINPWDHPVPVHTYEEYEDELREKMIAAGIPVEKEE
jgi:nitrate reductase gamma subunit